MWKNVQRDQQHEIHVSSMVICDRYFWQRCFILDICFYFSKISFILILQGWWYKLPEFWLRTGVTCKVSHLFGQREIIIFLPIFSFRNFKAVIALGGWYSRTPYCWMWIHFLTMCCFRCRKTSQVENLSLCSTFFEPTVDFLRTQLYFICRAFKL